MHVSVIFGASFVLATPRQRSAGDRHFTTTGSFCREHRSPDRLCRERLCSIRESNLVPVPVPRIWPGYLAARALCTLHVHAREDRQRSNPVFPGTIAPRPHTHPPTPTPPVPSGRRAVPLHVPSRGSSSPHPPCALDELLHILRGVGRGGERDRPGGAGYGTRGAHLCTRSAIFTGAPHVWSSALHTPQTADNPSGRGELYSHRAKSRVGAPCRCSAGRSLARRPRHWHQ